MLLCKLQCPLHLLHSGRHALVKIKGSQKGNLCDKDKKRINGEKEWILKAG